MKKVVNVTATDIKKGVQGECNACPIALAVLRLAKKMIPAPVAVQVGDWASIYNPLGYMLYRATLPDVAINFIAKFDGAAHASAMKRCKPFKFTADFVKM